MATFSRLDNFIWITATVLQFTLLAVLVLRGAWKAYPIFTFYIGFEGIQAAGLFVLTHIHSIGHYDRLYWITTGPEFLIEVVLILDTAYRLFQSAPFRMRNTRVVLARISAVACVLAIVSSLFMRPPGTKGVALLASRGTLGIYLFLFLILTAASWLGTRDDVYVPRRLRAIWLGIAVSSFMFAARSIAFMLTGWTKESNAWDYAVNLSTVAVLISWSVVMWRPDFIKVSLPLISVPVPSPIFSAEQV